MIKLESLLKKLKLSGTVMNNLQFANVDNGREESQVSGGAISGYDLVEKMLDHFGDDGVAKLLECVEHRETEFVEFKTSCRLSDEEKRKGVSQDTLTWDIVKAVFAIANTTGGALLIGICDNGKDILPVPVGDDKEKFLRCDILDKLLPSQRRWSDGKGGRWSSTELPMVDPRLCRYSHGVNSGYVVVLLIEPCPKGRYIKFSDAASGNGKMLCYRKRGCGETVSNKDSETFCDVDNDRRIDRQYYLMLLQKFVPGAASSTAGRSSGPYVLKPFPGRDLDSCNDELVSKTDGHTLRSEFEPGVRIGNYQIMDTIGRGGMGVVYRAKHVTLGGEYALKAFKPTCGDCLLQKEKFVIEAKTLENLKHDGLPKVYDCAFDLEKECLYLVEDLLVGEDGQPHELGSFTCQEGGSLTNELTSVPESQALDWLHQLCEIVVYLHRDAKVAHRDITLKNVLVTSDNKLKLTDFGIAKLMDEGLRRKIGVGVTTTVPQTFGTSHYLPPEVKENQKDKIDAEKTDVWALGVCFFKLLTGEWFSGQQFNEYCWQLEIWHDLLRGMLQTDSVKRITCASLLARLNDMEARTNRADHDLDFLYDCSDDELEPLVAAVLGTTDEKDEQGNRLMNENGNPKRSINRKGRFLSKLVRSEAYKQCYPEHSQYVSGIIAELQLFGSNSIASVFRRCGVTYREILTDVAKRKKVKFLKEETVEAIEEKLLHKVFTEIVKKLPPEKRDQTVEEIIGALRSDLSGTVVAEFIGSGLLSASGVAGLVASVVTEQLLGQGIAVAAQFGIASMAAGGALGFGVTGGLFTTSAVASAGGMALLSSLAPVALAIAGVSAISAITSPATRVTIPACIYIAALRFLKRNVKCNATLDDAKDVPFNVKVFIKSEANNKYICCDAPWSGVHPILANRVKADEWEKFELVHNEDGTVSIKSCHSGKYLTSEVNSDGRLNARVDEIREWEKFRIYRHSLTGHYALKAFGNDKFVAVDPNNGRLLAKESSCGERCFLLIERAAGQ